MPGLLRRLATTGAAYTASSVLSKLFAVFLLPIYTAYVSPAEYGAAEVMLASVVAISIVIRFGVIEAVLRFFYLAEPDEDPSGRDRSFGDRVIRSGFAALAWSATISALIALPFAGPISEALLGESDASLARVAILGLWTLTLWELVLTILRLDERARAYFTVTSLNVIATIPATLYLLIVEGLEAEAILLGTFGTGVLFLGWRIWQERHRLSLRFEPALLRRMLRFGLPTMPAELSLYSLSFIDRILIVRLAGLAEAGLYALAIKFAQGMNLIARGFQLAWPPLAYSIADDDEARRAYSLVFTWFAAVCAFFVVGLWLLARWIVRLLAAPEFFESYEAIGLLATGISLYALYLVLVVVLGRTGRTELSLPATFAGGVVNIGLNLALIPALGIVGAGIALVASYAVIVALTVFFTQRLFPIAYEWLRLGLLVGLAAATVAAGELLLPTDGALGLVARTVLWLAFPLVLWFARFPRREERELIRSLSSPAAISARLAEMRRRGAEAQSADEARGAHAPEVLEAERRDEDVAGS
ncbi:oligosaccharide flippase family protein [Thermoleophilia bacterium SCSIO 60948]|nr:oligosaccharide flippase family protein [Thermoleophilia bacterium SCSIO 60948]